VVPATFTPPVLTTATQSAGGGGGATTSAVAPATNDAAGVLTSRLGAIIAGAVMFILL
jgi:hypothetical protein